MERYHKRELYLIFIEHIRDIPDAFAMSKIGNESNRQQQMYITAHIFILTAIT